MEQLREERDRVEQLRERGEGQGGATEREGRGTGWSN